MTQTPLPAPAPDPFSLTALRLMEAGPQEAFDRIARLTARAAHAPVALVAILHKETNRQYLPGATGLPEPLESLRQAPLSHAFARVVADRNDQLAIADTRRHALTRDRPGPDEFGTIAYLGVPIHLADGPALGALCAIDRVPRDWSHADLAALADLAELANSEIRLRATGLDLGHAQAQAQRLASLRESIAVAFTTRGISTEMRFREFLRAGCGALGAERGAMIRVLGGMAETLYSSDDAQPARAAPPVHANRRTKSVLEARGPISFADASSGPDPHDPDNPGAFVGAPLILNGISIGTLEFTTAAPRAGDWSSEEMSILSVLALHACALLALARQIAGP